MMKRWNQALQLVIVVSVVVGIGCAPPASSPEAAKPLTDDARAPESVSADAPKIDNFDQSDGSLFEVKEPHKIEAEMLHLQAALDGTVLLSSLEGLSTEGYTASVKVMPPGVGEYAGLVFAVRGESSRILFYV